MIDVRQLRYGSHVLVGLDHPTFSVPKRVVMVTNIGYDKVEVTDDPQQSDREVYNASEISGILLTDIIHTLEKNGFRRSDRILSEYRSDKHRISFILDGFLGGNTICTGEEFIQRSGIQYLHQLEACISDAGINFEFNFKQ